VRLGLGIDISMESLRMARLNNRIHNEFAQADAHTLPILSKSLDALVAYDVVEHLDQIEVAIKEWKRCLKPAGKILLHAPVLGGNKLRGWLLRRIARAFRHPTWNRPEKDGHFAENLLNKDQLVDNND